MSEPESPSAADMHDGYDLIGPLAEEGLTIRTAKGVAWTGLVQIAAQPMTFIVGVLLARLLSPTDFGLTGMAAIFLGIVGLVNEFGLSAAVVQKPELSDDELSSIFWTNMLIGFASTALVAAAAKPISMYFHEPRLVPILLVLSLGFTIGSVPAIHGALLQRRMLFRSIATYSLVGVVINAVLALIMAVLGAGVWSLVIPGMLMGIVPGILTWIRAEWTPRWHLRVGETARLVKFGANVTASSIFNYGYTNLDYLTIGRTLGSGPLGVYTLAYNLVMFPFRKISSALASALFPAFSTIKEEDERMARAYLKTTRWLGMTTWPLLAAAGVLAPQFVLGLYGQKWSGAIIPFQILCIAGAQRSVGTIVGLVLRSKGRPDIEMYWSGASVVALGAALLIGYRYGVVGVATSVALSSAVLAPFIQLSALRLIDTPFTAYAAELAPGASLAATALVGAWLIRIPLRATPLVMQAAIVGGIALLLSLGVAYLMYRRDVLEIVQLMRDIVRRKRVASRPQ